MPLKVGPDPNTPGAWIWVDAASGQPASQPGGPGTPFIAQSDPLPSASSAASGPTTQPLGPSAPGVGSTPKVPGQTGQSIQQVVSSLGTGWSLKDPQAQPIEETAISTVPSSTPGLPSEKQAIGTGNYYVVVKGPDNIERALFLKADPSKDGKVARTSGMNDQTDEQKGNLYGGDLRDLSWTQSKPLGDIPASAAKQPSALGDLRKVDADGNDATKSGKPAVSLYDDKTGIHYPIPQGTQPAIHEFGNDLLLIQPDGTFSTITSKGDKPTTTNVPGIGVVTIDPSQPAGKKVSVELAEDRNAKASQFQPRVINGQTYLAVDKPGGGIAWQEAKDENGQPLPTDVTWTAVSNDPRSSKIQLIGSNGETKSIDKADFHPPPNPQAGQAVTPDTTAPYVVTIGDSGQPVFTDNQNRVSITDATRQFIDSLGVHLASGSMSEAQAQDLIKNITAQMTAQAAVQNAQANVLQGATTAAGNIVSGATQGATAGANLLNQRSQAAQNMVGSTLGILGHTQKGLLVPLPSDFGANLTGGAAAYATQLMGGDDVATAAANLVKAADPNNQSGIASQGYAVLQQMLQKYKDLTGTLHPLGAQANAQTQTQGQGFTSSMTAAAPTNFNPQASTATMNAQGFQDTPQGRAAAVAAGQGGLLATPQPQPQPVAQPIAVPSPAPGSPYMSYPNQVPGANYGSSVYAPGTPFVAPNTLPVPPGLTVAVQPPRPSYQIINGQVVGGVA